LADQGGSPETTTPWRVLLASRPLVLLLAVAFGYTFMWQFYITWFPTYLVERRGMDLREASRYASLPFAFGLAANWVGGVIADLLTRRYGARFGRGSLGFGALMLSASLLLVGIWYPGARAAALLIALAAGAGDMFLGAAWASAVAIGGKAAGAVSGLMNSASNFGGFVSPVLMGWAYERWQDWNTVLAIGVLANAISAFLWLGVNAGKERAGAGGSAARS
ncbi:MAG: MFS transporter, partial [Acidobacteria bacterium]|nr:MFS transporter [Acidobacteriota bacterium]